MKQISQIGADRVTKEKGLKSGKIRETHSNKSYLFQSSKKHLYTVRNTKKRSKMVSNEYLSLSFLALASLGAVIVTPALIESVIYVGILLILLWNWLYEEILTKLKIEDYVTTLIITSTIGLGVWFLFKGT